eukprot:GHVT01065193.1.p1 GENE.GHVT01065193.1~~GHVT01065193.1.p1  ORF type:complete len:147 (-),score=15.49 GHVT01065193.1:445-885(-)
MTGCDGQGRHYFGPTNSQQTDPFPSPPLQQDHIGPSARLGRYNSIDAQTPGSMGVPEPLERSNKCLSGSSAYSQASTPFNRLSATPAQWVDRRKAFHTFTAELDQCPALELQPNYFQKNGARTTRQQALLQSEATTFSCLQSATHT